MAAMDEFEKIPYNVDEIQPPTKGWKVGMVARATSTGEQGPVVKVEWKHITISVDGRPIKFEIHFVEKIDDAICCQNFDE